MGEKEENDVVDNCVEVEGKEEVPNNEEVCNKVEGNEVEDKEEICNKVDDKEEVGNEDKEDLCNKVEDNKEVDNEVKDKEGVCNKVEDKEEVCNKVEYNEGLVCIIVSDIGLLVNGIEEGLSWDKVEKEIFNEDKNDE